MRKIEEMDLARNNFKKAGEEHDASEENKLGAILEAKNTLEDKKRTLEIYSDFISKNENFKSKIKQAQDFVKDIESMIGYFEPISFDVVSLKPKIDDFSIKYRKFFRENKDGIWEATLIKFEKHIEDLKKMEKLLSQI